MGRYSLQNLIQLMLFSEYAVVGFSLSSSDRHHHNNNFLHFFAKTKILPSLMRREGLTKPRDTDNHRRMIQFRMDDRQFLGTWFFLFLLLGNGSGFRSQCILFQRVIFTTTYYSQTVEQNQIKNKRTIDYLNHFFCSYMVMESSRIFFIFVMLVVAKPNLCHDGKRRDESLSTTFF